MSKKCLLRLAPPPSSFQVGVRGSVGKRAVSLACQLIEHLASAAAAPLLIRCCLSACKYSSCIYSSWQSNRPLPLAPPNPRYALALKFLLPLQPLPADMHWMLIISFPFLDPQLCTGCSKSPFSCAPPLPADMHWMLKVISLGHVRTFTHHRLLLLEQKFNLHVMLNAGG